MNIDMIKQLYDYNYWAHQRVWNCVKKLSNEQLHQPFDYSIGSIHAQLVHTMGAEEHWFSRLRGVSPKKFFEPSDFPALSDIRSQWDKTEAAVREYIAALTPDKLFETVEYKRMNGEPMQNTLWSVLLHVVKSCH